MIKECKKEMYMKNGDVNRDYLKGQLMFNGSERMSGCQFGIVKGFYISRGRRLFVVENITTGENTNWWYDLKDGINKDLYIVKDTTMFV